MDRGLSALLAIGGSTAGEKLLESIDLGLGAIQFEQSEQFPFRQLFASRGREVSDFPLNLRRQSQKAQDLIQAGRRHLELARQGFPRQGRASVENFSALLGEPQPVLEGPGLGPVDLGPGGFEDGFPGQEPLLALRRVQLVEGKLE